MTAPLPPPSRRDLNSPAVLVPALLSGCLPLFVIFIAALVLPAALVAAAAWLLDLSDVQQVAAAVIVVGADPPVKGLIGSDIVPARSKPLNELIGKRMTGPGLN